LSQRDTGRQNDRREPRGSRADDEKPKFKEKRLMRKFLFVFLMVAAVAACFAPLLAEEMEDGKKFVIHGEIRQRGDFSENFFDLDDDTDDSGIFYPYRARIGAEGHFGKNVVGYVEFQVFGFWGDTNPNRANISGPVGNSSEFNNPFATAPFFQSFENSDFNDPQLYEGWVALNKIRGSNFSLKFGRQEIVRGSEMLLGDSDFYNGVSHDGVMANWQWENFSLDVFYTRPRQDFLIGIPGHENVNFWGGWAQWGMWENSVDVAAYALYYEDGNSGATFTPPSGPPGIGRRAFWTIGGRTGREISGKNGFNWNAEFAFQTGDQHDIALGGLGDNKDISANAFEAMIEYNLNAGGNDHRFHIGGATATGDEDSTDQDAEAFDPLFQDSHARYGYSDLFQLSDFTAVNAGYNVRIRAHTWGGDVWSYKLAEEIGGEDDLGKELDLFWKFNYSDNAQITIATAWFDAGDLFGTDTDKAVRAFANLRLRF
jgi:hypothetical protein